MPSLDSQLAELERTQLVRKLDEPDVAYSFKHVLAQETTYQSLLVKTRREIHLQVAAYYESVYTDAPDTYADLLAHHYFEGGDLANTFHYALKAGDAAARLYAHPEALVQYERALGALRRLTGTPGAAALDLAEIGRLYSMRGRVFELTSQHDRAAENYIEMEAVGRVQGNPTLELEGMIQRAILFATYSPLYDPVKGRELTERLLARAEEIGDAAVQAKALWIMVLLDKYGDDNIPRSIEHGERSLEIARALGLREQIAYTQNDLTVGYAMTEQFAKARAASEEAAEIWQDLGNLALLADNLSNKVWLDFYDGDFEESIQASVECLRLSQLTGSLWGQAYALMWVGDTYANRGEYSTALRIEKESMHYGQVADFIPPLVATRSDYAWMLGRIGLFEEGLREIKLAYDLLPRITQFSALNIPIYIRLALRTGDVALAHTLSHDALIVGFSAFKNSPEGSSRLALANAELAMAHKDWAGALAHLETAIAYQERNQLKAFLPELLYGKAQALEAQGDTEAAIAVLQDARHRAVALPAYPALWQILGRLSRLEARRGHADVAAESQAEKETAIKYIAERIDSAEYREAFLSYTRAEGV